MEFPICRAGHRGNFFLKALEQERHFSEEVYVTIGSDLSFSNYVFSYRKMCLVSLKLRHLVKKPLVLFDMQGSFILYVDWLKVS